MYVGFAFFNKAIKGLVPRHLNVVIEMTEQRCTLVNFTTYKQEKPTPGRVFRYQDWQKIDHASVVSWQDCRVVTVDDLKFMINRCLMQTTEDCPTRILKLILHEKGRLGK